MTCRQTLTATYRITTPMFCSGADQSKAELRLPSFKGALRFWWRALMWGEVNDVEELHQREAELFGSSEQGQSKVRMRLECDFLQKEDQQDWSVNDWQSYVGYGLIETTGGNSRKYIKQNQPFDIKLSWPKDNNHPGALPHAQQDQVHRALIALGLFGGLGGRSRKGWGNVQLEKITGAASWNAPKSVSDLRQQAEEFLHSASDKMPCFTAFSKHTRLAIGPEQSDTESAHRWISDKYKEFVRKIDNNTEREVFGLPRANTGSDRNARRASPVFIHIHELQGNGAVPVVLFLPAQFLENRPNPGGDWRQLEQFIRSISPNNGVSP